MSRKSVPCTARTSTSIVEILVASPAELLHDDVFRAGKPGVAFQQRDIYFSPPPEFLLHERIVEEFEQLDLHVRLGLGDAYLTASPRQSVELSLRVENQEGFEGFHHRRYTTAHMNGDKEVHIPGRTWNPVGSGRDRAHGHERNSGRFGRIQNEYGKLLQIHADCLFSVT